MKTTATELSPAALGEAQRKVMPRTALADFSSKDRKRNPLELLADSVHDRIPSLVKLKNERMACSPFAFFRGAVPVMAYDLSLHPHTGIINQLCGDAHVQNLGAYEGPDGRLIFDINDFDETIRGPFEWDVKRMATSILLAADSAKLKSGCAREAVQLFLESYCELMRKFSHMPVLAVARFQVHRLASIAPVSKLLRQAEHATPMASLEKLTGETARGRVFKSNKPVLYPITGAEARQVLASLPEYTRSLLPERRHFFAQFKPVAVGFKVVGTGSVGLRDYCILMHGNGPSDPMFLQIKQESHSAYAPYLKPSPPPARHQGQRTVEGQRAMQLQSDPLLGWTTIDGRSYLVRQLNDHKAAVDITTLKAPDLGAYAIVCGEMLARGHARSGDARIITGYVGNGVRFKTAIEKFASAYAEQTVEDWKLHVAQRAEKTAKVAQKQASR